MDQKTKDRLIKRVNQVLEHVRPYLQADGGDILLKDISNDMVVHVELTGACDGCPFSQQTLKAGVEQVVLKKVPEIKGVEAVNHSQK